MCDKDTCNDASCCGECEPWNCVEQQINDALATKEGQLQGYVNEAKDAAAESKASAEASAQSAAESKEFRDEAETAASTAVAAEGVVLGVANTLQDTADKLEQIADELGTAIAGIAVSSWFYTTVSENQTVIPVPSDKNAVDVQSIYIEGTRQSPFRGFEFDKTAMTITLAEPLPLGLEIEIILGTYNSDNPNDFAHTLASNNGASLVGTSSGNSVQEILNSQSGSFQSGVKLFSSNDLIVDKSVTPNQLYRWDGALPKIVDAGLTPEISGGIGVGAWVGVGDAMLRSSLDSHTLPGASLVSLPNGTVNDAIKYVTPEMFRYASDTTDDQMFRRMWDYAIPRNLNIDGGGEYNLAETYEVPEVHTPPVRYDFNIMTIKLRKVVYTASSGVAFINRSPGCVFEIGELAGTASFTVLDQTIGFQLMGQGHIPNVIHVVHGFATNVMLDECFTRAIHVGECYNALRGVRGVVANANIVYGKIGGGFSESTIDPTTCEVGVTFDANSNTNEIFANIEYCRRSENSRPFVDDGATNKFYGYIESCSLPGLVNGSFARYQVKNGGNNVRTGFGYEVSGTHSSIEMLDAVVDDGVPVTDGNSTITNKNLQSALSKSNQSEVLSRNSKELLSLGKVNQYIVDSNDLVTASWNLAVSGAATAGDLSLTSGVLNTGASNQYRYGTNVVASVPTTSESDYYVISQNITAAFTGDLSFGIALRMNLGDADFFLKVQSVTGNILYSKAFRMTGKSKIVEHFHSIPTQFIESDTYSVQLHIRTWEASNFDVFNIHLCNGAGIERAPASIGTGVTPFQPVSHNAIGYKPNSVCKTLTAPITIKQYDFDTYVIGAVDGNIILSTPRDGEKVTFYKQGTSNTNLLSTETIDGQSLVPLTAGLKITIQFIAEIDQWVTISKNT